MWENITYQKIGARVIFISYSFKDKELAQIVADYFCENNIEYFMAEEHIEFGDKWFEEIAYNPKQSDNKKKQSQLTFVN